MYAHVCGLLRAFYTVFYKKILSPIYAKKTTSRKEGYSSRLTSVNVKNNQAYDARQYISNKCKLSLTSIRLSKLD